MWHRNSMEIWGFNMFLCHLNNGWNCSSFMSHRIHGAGILMLTSRGYIDGIHVTIYSTFW